MVEVGGLWELGWSAPLTELTQWEMVMRSFGVERLNMAPVSGIDKRWVYEYPTMEALLEDRVNLTQVFVDESGEQEVFEYQHPQDALYIFGKATYSPFSSLAKDKVSLRIDCLKMGMLWPHQALAIVLHDRHSKL